MLQCVAITATADTVSCLCRGACTTSLDSLSRVLFVLHRLRKAHRERKTFVCSVWRKNKEKNGKRFVCECIRFYDIESIRWVFDVMFIRARQNKTEKFASRKQLQLRCTTSVLAVNWNEIRRILFLFFDENRGTKSFLIDSSSATICASFETIERRRQRPKAALDCNPKIEEWSELNTKSKSKREWSRNNVRV